MISQIFNSTNNSPFWPPKTSNLEKNSRDLTISLHIWLNCENMVHLTHLHIVAMSKKPVQKIVLPASQPKESLENHLLEVEAEFKSCSERVELLSNPQYVPDLKQRILGLDVKIKKLGKNKKIMELSQKKTDDRFKKAEDEEPELSLESTGLKKMVSTHLNKVKEVDLLMEKNGKSLTEMNTKMGELKGELKKLTDQATELSIDPNGKSGGIKEVEEKFEVMAPKKEGLTKTLNLLKTRYNMTLGEYNQKTQKLQQELDEVAESVQAKNVYLVP